MAPANLFERRRKQKRWSAKPTFPDSNSLHGRRRQAGERRSARSARVNPREGGGQPEPSRAQRHRRRTPPRRQERGPRDRAASRSPRPYSGRSAIIVVSTLQTVPIAVCNSSRRCGPSFRHAPYASPAPAARCRSARSRNKESNELVSNGLLIRPMKMETQREVARREPPAAGLTACLRRNADGIHGSHKIKNAQLRTIYPLVTGSIKCRSRVAKPQRLYAYLF